MQYDFTLTSLLLLLYPCAHVLGIILNSRQAAGADSALTVLLSGPAAHK